MLRTINEMIGYEIEAVDGTIGKVSDVLFDEEHWTARYLVGDTRKWLPGRKVLLSPTSFTGADWEKKRVSVDLTREQVEQSPPLEFDEPVHRRYEKQLAAYYRWPTYWVVGQPVGSPLVPPEAQVSRTPTEPETDIEPGLRSVDTVTGYHVLAADGEIGHIEGFVADDASWVVRYLVVDTRNLLPGRKVLVAPDWVAEISWDDSRVRLELTREEIQKSPPYDPGEPINREFEEMLYDYYGRPRYWDRGDV